MNDLLTTIREALDVAGGVALHEIATTTEFSQRHAVSAQRLDRYRAALAALKEIETVPEDYPLNEANLLDGFSIAALIQRAVTNESTATLLRALADDCVAPDYTFARHRVFCALRDRLNELPVSAEPVFLTREDWETLDRILGDYQQIGAQALIEPLRAVSIAANIRRQTGGSDG